MDKAVEDRSPEELLEAVLALPMDEAWELIYDVMMELEELNFPRLH